MNINTNGNDSSYSWAVQHAFNLSLFILSLPGKKLTLAQGCLTLLGLGLTFMPA